MSRWTAADVARVKARHGDATATVPHARAKFGNQKKALDGFLFDSKKEAEHYLLLKMRERLKEIEHLELQPVFPLYGVPLTGGDAIHVGDFTPDFRYWEHQPGGAVLRVVDVKSEPTKTEAYRLRKKMAEAIYGITIIEL